MAETPQLRGLRNFQLTSVPAGAEAKSLKCSDCGKVFRSQATASFHAEKSGHENFEESTEEVSLPSRMFYPLLLAPPLVSDRRLSFAVSEFKLTNRSSL